MTADTDTITAAGTIKLIDDDTGRRLTTCRILLERAYDGLEQLERDADRELQVQLEEISMLIALTLDDLPRP